jgi:DNA-binding NarL/FixJ family response regulator
MDLIEARMHCAPPSGAFLIASLFFRTRLTGSGAVHRPRESGNLALVQPGRSKKEVARQLAINSAVKNQMHDFLQKLQVRPAARLRVFSDL